MTEREQGEPEEATGRVRMTATLTPTAGGTRVVLVAAYRSVEQLQRSSTWAWRRGCGSR